MKTVLLFIVVCLLFIVPQANAWYSWEISSAPVVVSPAPQPIPQYEIQRVPFYDAYGNFLGYREERVFVGYVYPYQPQPRYYTYTESFWFTIGNSGGHYDRDDHRGSPRGHYDGHHR